MVFLKGVYLAAYNFPSLLTLYLKKTVDIIKSLFCDDGLFWATGNTIIEARDKIQKALDCLTNWCKETGFKISTNKTFFVIFTRKQVPRVPSFTLCGHPIERKMSAKYLGITFDSKLTWQLHVDDLVERCKNPLSLMKLVARRQWGGDRKTLTLMYTSLVRSKIDYGSFLYATAKHTHLLKLDRVQYEAIRIIAGLLRATKVVQLEVEANIVPLEFRRDQLMMNYFINVIRIRNNPVTIDFFNFHDHLLYYFRPYSRPVIGRA